MGLPSAKQDLTDAFLAHVPAPEGEGWLARARRAAHGRVASLGLPMARDEYWRYTKPDGFTAFEPAFGTKSEAAAFFDTTDAVTLTFVDGVFDAAQSDPLELAGCKIELLSGAGALDLHWAQDLFGALETTGQTPVDRSLAALTTLIAPEGVLIHVTGETAKPIRLRYLSSGGQPSLHHVVKLEAGARLTLLEEGLPGARSSINMEVDVAEGAAFNHVRVQGPQDARQALTSIFTRLAKASAFKSFTLALNGALTRNEVVVDIQGDETSAHIAGAAYGDAGFHHDDTVFVTHDAAHCESRQVFKKVLKNGAVGVFQGKILVQPDAQKTDGYQISQGLLLDEDSQFLAKPELEIYADDVACSHGSTCGSVDEDQLFYLTSRGIPKDAAADLLVLSFMAEAIGEIEDEALGELVTNGLADLLSAR